MAKFYLLIFICSIFFIACKEEKPKSVIDQNKVVKNVKHYICNNNCENSGGDAAGNCPVCKTPYTHNTAFHSEELLKNGPLKVQSNATQTAPTNNKVNTPSPAQNSIGVYHYTCSNGCNGGSGSASNCNTCGNPLAHNQAYHN